ncbi:MAG: hypothetical protein RJA20_2809 [Bacteroidota bacterium]|jgi:outer membrane protein OmpA-like peptidoglycan-associated protein
MISLLRKFAPMFPKVREISIKHLVMFSTRKLFRIALATLLPVCMYAQKEAPILLTNPSFEDIPHIGQVGGSGPTGWYDCPSRPGESAPDVQPGFWKVTRPPSNGSSFLGLVVREKESWEGVGQRLSRPLEINHCYEFSLDLCKSETYFSPTSVGSEEVPFTTPAKIIIWGGNGYCDKAEVLDQSTIITHSRWITYNFRLSPKKSNYSYIMIEAYYKTPVLFPYNGHVLVDNASSIKPVACNPEKMPTPTPKPPAETASAGKKTPSSPASGTASSPASGSADSKTEAPIGKSTKKNVVYRLEKVYFDASKYELKQESEPQLYELLNFLKKRPDVVIEVGGHTNNTMWPNDAQAMDLSTKRAKAVAEWLVSHGIPSNRVQYKGYGWTKPIMPNTTPEGRKKNQRVEATIISSNG